MTRLFFFFLLIFSSQMASAQEGYLVDFEQKWRNAASYTIALAESMPEETFDYQPTEDQMAFSRQLLHIVGNMSWLSSSYLGGRRPERDLGSNDYSKAEVLDILREGFELAGQAAAGLSAEALDENVKFFAGPMNKRQILTLMNDHVTHHRGQLIVYLRLKGIVPPKYKGW